MKWRILAHHFTGFNKHFHFVSPPLFPSKWWKWRFPAKPFFSKQSLAFFLTLSRNTTERPASCSAAVSELRHPSFLSRFENWSCPHPLLSNSDGLGLAGKGNVGPYLKEEGDLLIVKVGVLGEFQSLFGMPRWIQKLSVVWLGSKEKHYHHSFF